MYFHDKYVIDLNPSTNETLNDTLGVNKTRNETRILNTELWQYIAHLVVTQELFEETELLESIVTKVVEKLGYAYRNIKRLFNREKITIGLWTGKFLTIRDVRNIESAVEEKYNSTLELTSSGQFSRKK